jgi:hypothetical protein
MVGPTSAKLAQRQAQAAQASLLGAQAGAQPFAQPQAPQLTEENECARSITPSIART